MSDNALFPEPIAYNETRINLSGGCLEIICAAGFECRTETLPMSVKFSRQDSARILMSLKAALDSGQIQFSESSEPGVQ